MTAAVKLPDLLSELDAIEEEVRKAGKADLTWRWKSGHALLAYRGGAKRLPDKMLSMLSERYKVSRTELSKRMEFASNYPTTVKLHNAVTKLGNWHSFCAGGSPHSPHSTLSQSNEWYTPVKYIEAARKVLGGIDLDPASCDFANRTVGAKKFYDATDNGLAFEWPGRVWLNPPWGDLSADFISKLVAEFREGKTTAAIALVNAHATDTDWFQPLWNYVLCFTDHRIDYNSPDDKHSSSTHGSVFVYMGPRETTFAQHFTEWGTIVKRWP